MFLRYDFISLSLIDVFFFSRQIVYGVPQTLRFGYFYPVSWVHLMNMKLKHNNVTH